jgi:hypothetical protein
MRAPSAHAHGCWPATRAAGLVLRMLPHTRTPRSTHLWRHKQQQHHGGKHGLDNLVVDALGEHVAQHKLLARGCVHGVVHSAVRPGGGRMCSMHMSQGSACMHLTHTSSRRRWQPAAPGQPPPAAALGTG